MDPRTNWAIEAYMPPRAKAKGRIMVWTSKGREAIHLKMLKQMFGKQIPL